MAEREQASLERTPQNRGPLAELMPWTVALWLVMVATSPVVALAQDMDGLLDRLREKVQGAPESDLLPQVDVTAEPQLMTGVAGEHARRLLSELDRMLGNGARDSTAVEGSAQVAYVDDRGAVRRVDSMEQVPVEHRDHAVAAPVDAPSAPQDSAEEAPSASTKAPQKVYRYRGENGRTLYTNIATQIPEAERGAAEMDLSHVPLNSELGTQINQRLSQAHARLSQSKFCDRVRDGDVSAVAASTGGDAGGPMAWAKNHIPVLASALLLLLLFAISPAMMRRVDPQAWRRVLMFMIPVLVAFGGIGQSLGSGGSHGDALASAERACDPESFSALGQSASPLNDRLRLVTSLRSQAATLESIHQQSR